MAETIDSAADRSSAPKPGAWLTVIVAARDEEDRIAATIAALAEAFPEAAVWVADDGSVDATARLAKEAGANVVSAARPAGKGGAMTAVAEQLLERDPLARVYLLCDGDLGASAARLGPLAEAVRGVQAELAIAVFSSRVGGGLGLAVGVAGWLIQRRSGFRARAPLSGQRALSRAALAEALPFASGYGMEVGMTLDALRAGRRVLEIELDLEHRATGRSVAGFLHRGRQLLDILRAGAARR